MTETTWFLALGAGVWIAVLVWVARAESRNITRTPKEREDERSKRLPHN